MTSTISHIDNTIDSRDLEARIKELQESIEQGQDESGDLEELKLLAEFKATIGDDCFRNEETLIHEGYFTDYIEELIKDCFELPKEFDSGNWPYRHMTMDYEAAAEEAKVDYAEAEFDGTTYYYRSC